MSLQSPTVLPSQAARPLRHWSEAARERARSHVERIWATWCDRWQLANDGTVVLNACDAAVAPSAHWHRVAAHPLWLSSAAADRGSLPDELQAVLFGKGRVPASVESTSIARDVADESLADLLRTLSQLAGSNDARGVPAGDAPPAEDTRRWSGVLAVQVSAEGPAGTLDWTLRVGGSVAANLCGASRAAPARSAMPLAQVTDALQDRRMSFNVLLEDTTLTLGSLQMLRIGDVIPLAHRLDQPLRVVAAHSPEDAVPFCAAYLGRRDNFRAVELLPAATASQSSNS